MTNRDDDSHITQRTVLSPGPSEPDPHPACVVVIHGEGLGRRVDVRERPVLIGRSPEADLHIAHPSVSRRHCELWRDHAGYHVRDLGATNPTRLNDEPVEQAVVRDGDHLTVGEAILKFIGHASVEARYHEEVYQLATQDALTELCNRRHFIELLEKEIARAQRHSRPLVFAIVDLDHFKVINDRHGHIAGDLVLKQFSEILRRQVRADDIAARIGGEEFAVVLPETGIDHAMEFAERLRAAVAAAVFTPGGERRQVTVSIGLAVLDARRGDRSALMRAADVALYRAKDEGRDRVRVADD